MKKLFLWVLVTMFCCVYATAQTVGVAVLTHGDSNTMFYGNTALQEAVKAATDGDVISLSPGTFIGLKDFSKSGLTIIGSGMIEGPSQTILTGGALRASYSSKKFVKLTLKNVYIDGSFIAGNGNYELSLEKCRVNGTYDCDIEDSQTSTIKMVNCVTGNTKSNDKFSNTILSAYNCVLRPADIGGDVSRSRVLANCILLCSPANGTTGTLNNCIIIANTSTFPSEIRATNCVALTEYNNYFLTQSLSNKVYKGEAFIEGSFYELKPELASIWVDENGEQIGIYGGPEPFSVLPDAPHFTKFNVPSRTDADGKLSVEIEVALPEK